MSTYMERCSVRNPANWATALIAAAALFGIVNASRASADDATISAAGVEFDFSATQALFNEKCALCHGIVGDAGRPYPRWLGDTHAVYTMTESDLFVFLRQTMPLDQPGSLTDTEYLALVAFLRKTSLGR